MGYASPSTTAPAYVASPASSGRRRNDENGFDVGGYDSKNPGSSKSNSNLDNHQHYILPTKLPSQSGRPTQRYRVRSETGSPMSQTGPLRGMLMIEPLRDMLTLQSVNRLGTKLILNNLED